MIRNSINTPQIALADFNSFVIFGAGNYGQIISEDIEKHCRITGKPWVFADNNHEKINATMGGGVY